MALHQHFENAIPRGHANDQFEGPLELVLIQRHIDMGNRLKDITAMELLNLAHYTKTETAPFLVTVNFARDVQLAMPWTPEQLIDRAPWTLYDAWSYSDCYIESNKRDRKYMKDLVLEQFPQLAMADEKVVFTYPHAADKFKDLIPENSSSPRSSNEAASPAASDGEVAEAGSPAAPANVLVE